MLNNARISTTLSISMTSIPKSNGLHGLCSNPFNLLYLCLSRDVEMNQQKETKKAIINYASCNFVIHNVMKWLKFGNKCGVFFSAAVKWKVI